MSDLATHYDYYFYVILMMIGLYAMIGKNNLVKKIIGMAIFQAAIVLFYVSAGVKTGATIPIVHHAEHAEYHEESHADNHEEHAKDLHVAVSADADSASHETDVDAYMNPLPHVLMLTAIVVGVATLGVALALIQRLNGIYGTVEEDEILEQLRR
ncbi:MAG: multicomponent Na+:H+ antiporter subunit C [Rhodothermales bacterium]|jgi:multicomponent Na+:H+ antiporter subunit C